MYRQQLDEVDVQVAELLNTTCREKDADASMGLGLPRLMNKSRREISFGRTPYSILELWNQLGEVRGLLFPTNLILSMEDFNFALYPGGLKPSESKSSVAWMPFGHA